MRGGGGMIFFFSSMGNSVFFFLFSSMLDLALFGIQNFTKSLNREN